MSVFRLKNNKTYILPSSFGYAFILTVFILFAMAIGSANNLIYLFTFFLVSTAFTGMILTNRNVAGAVIVRIRGEELFANESGDLLVLLEKKKAMRSVQELSLGFSKKQLSEVVDVLSGDSGVFRLSYTPVKRGEQNLLPLRLQSSYPFSMFIAWKYFRESEKIVVYPERRGVRMLPFGLGASANNSEAGLFLEHREYLPTDSARRIDWRASARRQKTLIKTFEVEANRVLRLDWSYVAHLDSFEDRISQLALWIDESEKQKIQYSLSIGKLKTALSQGSDHRRLCLTYLALLKEKDIN